MLWSKFRLMARLAFDGQLPSTEAWLSRIAGRRRRAARVVLRGAQLAVPRSWKRVEEEVACAYKHPPYSQVAEMAVAVFRFEP